MTHLIIVHSLDLLETSNIPHQCLWAGLVSQEEQVFARFTSALVSLLIWAKTCDRFGKSVVSTHSTSKEKWVLHHYQTVANYQWPSFPLICIVTHLIITFYLTFTSCSHTSDVNEQQRWGSCFTLWVSYSFDTYLFWWPYLLMYSMSINYTENVLYIYQHKSFAVDFYVKHHTTVEWITHPLRGKNDKKDVCRFRAPKLHFLFSKSRWFKQIIATTLEFRFFSM